MPLSEEALLLLEEIATADPYRLFSSTGTVWVCRFCLHTKQSKDHALNCEYIRANEIRELNDDDTDTLFDE